MWRLGEAKRAAAVALLAATALLTGVAGAHAATFDSLSPTFGQPHKVTWDRQSLMIDGQRTPIWSGEFHPFRLPSPELWRDVLEKMKAGGFNTVSIYVSWQYHSSAPGVYDFTGVRDVDRLLTMAQQAGLYVIVRPGPYINAEVDAGGFPGWLTRQLGPARTVAPDYQQAWTEYLSALDPIIARHQITRGGNVIAYQIENELVRTENNNPYMRALVSKVRADGIDVPTTANNFVPPGWADITDLNGPDVYPQGFDCTHPDTWGSGLAPQIDNVGSEARVEAPLTPEFSPEFQGGAFDPWGGPGYAKCYQLTNGSFQKVLNDTFTAQGVTMRSLYMTYGGTSWGWQAVPSDYTSYDYGAPIDEARELTPKYYDLKRMAYATEALPQLTDTNDMGAPSGSNSDLLYKLRENPGTHTQFVFLRHSDPTSTAEATTTLSLKTTDGAYPTVPQQPGTAIHVHGRDMKMLVADYDIGAEHLVYSTSELMTATKIDGRDVAVLYAAKGDPGETVLRYRSQPTVTNLEGKVGSTWDAARGDLRLDYVHDGLARVLIHGDRGDLLLVIDDEQDSGRIWLTDTTGGPVLTYGPYLVRSAALSGGALALTGDTSATFPADGQLGGATGTSAWSAPLDRRSAPTTLRVLAAPALARVTWDGATVRMRSQPGGALAGTLPGPPAVQLPALSGWRFSAEAPEAQPGFDDSSWTKADHTTTNNLTNPPGTLPVLYMDDYGFHYGDVWYRGHFTATGGESGITLDCATGGGPSACSAWVNGHFLGTWASGQKKFAFPAGALLAGKDNVISVLAENDGHPEDFATSLEQHKAPRGLKGATLEGTATQPSWLIQGDAGGEHPTETTRGPLNNGGLFGERSGWYLPGFDDSSWKPVSLPDRWSARGVPPGVGWYRTSFTLDLPRKADVPIGLRITDDPKQAYEALIFVNGWMMGRYANAVGPQHLFYLPEGVVDPHGRNVVAIAVISHGADGSGGGLGTVSLEAYGRYGQSGPVRALCRSRRSVVVHVRARHGRRLRSLGVYVRGRRVRVVRAHAARRLAARIDLRGLPKGTVHVRLVARTTTGRRIVERRTYHTCVHKRPRR